MPKLIIFDFDGVIVDSLHAAHSVWAEAGATITVTEYTKHFEGNIHSAPKPIATLDFAASYATKTPLLKTFPGIYEVIKTLSQHYVLTINSSSYTDMIRQVLVNHNLSSYFHSVLGADVATSKVEKIKLAIANHQTAPDQTIMITDTLGDLREANQVGLKTIAVTWGFHDLTTLQKGYPTTSVDQPTDIIKQVDKILNPLS